MIIHMKPCSRNSHQTTSSENKEKEKNKAQRGLPLPLLTPDFMSIQDKNAGFELNDMEFPELSAKLTGRKEKGRRSAVAARHAKNLEKKGAMLVKTIDDPNHVLGKRRKERIASESNDGFAPNLAYSLNKNNRWNGVNAMSLLENDSELPIDVVERVMTSKGNSVNVVSLHAVDDNGDVRVATASGKGTSLNSIVIGGGKKHRGRKARKEMEAAAVEAAENGLKSGDEDESTASTARLQYTIYKPHKNHKVLAGKLFNRGYNTRKAGKARADKKKVPMDELEMSELEQSIHIDEPLYKPSRDFKFCLGDYLTESSHSGKPSAAVFVRRQSIESVQQGSENMENSDTSNSRPIKLLDISPILRIPVAFEWVLLDTSYWNGFNFGQQVESLKLDEKLDVQWLDADKSRVSINASLKSTDKPHATPTCIVIIEKVSTSKKNHIKVLLNSDLAPTGPFSWQILKSLLKHASNLDQVVTLMSKLVGEWEDGSAPDCVSDSINKLKSRFEQRRDYFLPAYNATALSKSAQVLTAARMATLVREEGRHVSGSGETFERIDFDSTDIDFCTDSENDEDSKTEDSKVKCVTCDNSFSTELFELDDCWRCRDCLRHHIIEKIRSKSVPLDIPFVVGEGQSVYDILPAIIPLPLLNFYTKLTAIEMLKHSDVDIGDIGECPSCKQLVHIDRPNEYNICNCVSCGIHWCPDCGFEPHYPMSCSSFATWIDKWEKEYNLHVLEKTETLKKIKCACGYNMEMSDKTTRAECGGCGRVFNPQNMKMLERSYWSTNLKTGELIRMNEASDELQAISVEYIPAAKTIKKEFSEVIGKARKMRFGTSKKNEFEKAVRKMKKELGADKLREIRKTILMIVENGLAFVYIEKKKEMNTLKQNLVQLMKLWLEIECELQEPRQDFHLRVETIESSISKTLELIKSFV